MGVEGELLVGALSEGEVGWWWWWHSVVAIVAVVVVVVVVVVGRLVLGLTCGGGDGDG